MFQTTNQLCTSCGISIYVYFHPLIEICTSLETHRGDERQQFVHHKSGLPPVNQFFTYKLCIQYRSKIICT